MRFAEFKADKRDRRRIKVDLLSEFASSRKSESEGYLKKWL